VRLPPLDALPSEILRRWPSADPGTLRAEAGALASLPIDHAVAPARDIRGGFRAAATAVRRFLDERLDHYADDRNQPEQDTTSGLSPYLHFGHVSAHAIFEALMTREGWTSRRLHDSTRGNREGWWGTAPPAEAFLDELITWRELGFATSHHRQDHAAYESLPAWARGTLDAHAGDPREHRYALETFASAATHDPLWNAAQVQLLREGRIHNYLRMLWGKKILEWSASPREALAVMVELNNRYALDGRDPNSYSGIFWVLGRYDRPWAPERPIFGTVRYMSSQNTARKVRVRGYIRQYSPDDGGAPLFGTPDPR
jgi:deoxyribodipyrimidine photo-lyase